MLPWLQISSIYTQKIVPKSRFDLLVFLMLRKFHQSLRKPLPNIKTKPNTTILTVLEYQHHVTVKPKCNNEEKNVKATKKSLFRKYYLRRDIPISINFNAIGKLDVEWKVSKFSIAYPKKNWINFKFIRCNFEYKAKIDSYQLNLIKFKRIRLIIYLIGFDKIELNKRI